MHRVDDVEDEIGNLREEKDHHDGKEKRVNLSRMVLLRKVIRPVLVLRRGQTTQGVNHAHRADDDARQWNQKDEDDVQIGAHEQAKQALRAERAQADRFVVDDLVFEPEWKAVDDAEYADAAHDAQDTLRRSPFTVGHGAPTADEQESIDGNGTREIDLHEEAGDMGWENANE